MPTLVRLLTALAIIAALTLSAMVALVTFVEPTQRRMTSDVPLPGLRAPAERGGEPLRLEAE